MTDPAATQGGVAPNSKNAGEGRRERFNRLRTWAFKIRADVYVKGVCQVIVQRMENDGWSPVSISRLAIEGGMSPNKARDVLDTLEAAGELIRKQSKGGGPSRFYLIGNTAHGEWLNPSCKEGLRKSRRSGKGKSTLHAAHPNPSPDEPQPFTPRTPKIGIWSSGSKKEDSKERIAGGFANQCAESSDVEVDDVGGMLRPRCGAGGAV